MLFYLKWFFWDLSGLRAISGKIIPPKDPNTGYRKPATFLLWALGVYVALFGVASQRYENKMNTIEIRANGIFAQLSSTSYKHAIARIPSLQHTPCPTKPDLLNPASVFQSLFAVYHSMPLDPNAAGASVQHSVIDGPNTENLWSVRKNLFGHQVNSKEIGNWLKQVVENYAYDLTYVDLESAILDEAQLEDANLVGIDLSHSNLRYSNLSFANLTDSNLTNADIEGAYLLRANLSGADLWGADLSSANLKGAIFDGAHLEHTYLIGAKNLSLEQLQTVATLADVRLDPNLATLLKQTNPELFNKKDMISNFESKHYGRVWRENSE